MPAKPTQPTRSPFASSHRRLAFGTGLVLATSTFWLPTQALQTLAPLGTAAQAQDMNDPVEPPTVNADQQFLFAYRLLQKNEQTMAGEALDQYLADHPQGARAGDARYYRALLYQQQGDWDMAVAMLENAPAPTLLPAWRLTLLHAQLLAQKPEHGGKAVALLTALDPSKLPDGDRALLLYETGRLQQLRNNLPAAIDAYQKSLEIESAMQSRAAFALGQAQIRFGQNEQAIDSLTIAARLAKADNELELATRAARMAGEQAQTLKLWPQAIANFEHALATGLNTPHAATCIVGLLSSQTQAKNPKAVVATYTEHRDRLPANLQPTADFLAAAAFAQLGQPQDAEKALSQITDLAADYPPGDAVLFRLAQAQADQQAFDRVVKTTNQLVKEFPQSGSRIDAAFLQAAAYRQLDQPKQAAQSLSAVINGPTDQVSAATQARALLLRAAANEQAKQANQALNDYVAYFEAQPVVDQTPSATQSAAMLRLMHLAHQERDWLLILGLGRKWAEQYKLEPAIDADLLFRLGTAAVAAKANDDAEWAFARLMDQHPDAPGFARAAYHRARIAAPAPGNPGSEATGDDGYSVSDRSMVLYAQALAADQPLPQSWQTDALRQLVQGHAERDQPAEAAKQLQALETLAGTEALSTSDLIWLAQRLQKDGDHAKAIGRYDAALARLAETDIANATPGAPGSDPGAEQNKQQALQSFALYQKALCQQSLAQWQPSIETFNQLLAADNSYQIKAKLGQAESLRESGQDAVALDAYRGLMDCRIAIVESEAFYQAGVLLLKMDQLEEAKRMLLRLTLLYTDPALAPWPDRGHLALHDVYLALGEPDQAQDTLNQLVHALPHSPIAQAIAIWQTHTPLDAPVWASYQEQHPDQDPALTQWLTKHPPAPGTLPPDSSNPGTNDAVAGDNTTNANQTTQATATTQDATSNNNGDTSGNSGGGSGGGGYDANGVPLPTMPGLPALPGLDGGLPALPGGELPPTNPNNSPQGQ